MSTGGSFAFLGILIVVYFMPTIVAVRRNRPNKGAITLLNVFLGWTLIGWVAALVWAASNSTTVPSPVNAVPISVPDGMKTCPRCAEDVKAAAMACRYCGHEFNVAGSQP